MGDAWRLLQNFQKRAPRKRSRQAEARSSAGCCTRMNVQNRPRLGFATAHPGYHRTEARERARICVVHSRSRPRPRDIVVQYPARTLWNRAF